MSALPVALACFALGALLFYAAERERRKTGRGRRRK